MTEEMKTLSLEEAAKNYLNTDKKPVGFLDDNSGNHSSKRLIGVILIAYAMIQGGIITYYDLVKGVQAGASIKVFEVILTAAAAIFLGTVAEKFNFWKKNND